LPSLSTDLLVSPGQEDLSVGDLRATAVALLIRSALVGLLYTCPWFPSGLVSSHPQYPSGSCAFTRSLHLVFCLFISSSKKSKKRPEVATKPKPLPRFTIFDEDVDPDRELFDPGRKLSPESSSKNMPQDCKYRPG
jgi:hypothetical protein